MHAQERLRVRVNAVLPIAAVPGTTENRSSEVNNNQDRRSLFNHWAFAFALQHPIVAILFFLIIPASIGGGTRTFLTNTVSHFKIGAS